MRTGLDHLPARKQRELARTVQLVHREFDAECEQASAQWKKRARIVKIVLFGSHARGDWTEDPASGYVSDYDVLVVLNDKRAKDFDAWDLVEERLNRAGARTPTNMIVHTLHEVNTQLQRARYFFIDIIKDGIALYQLDPSRGFARPGHLTAQEALAEAQQHFEHWHGSAEEFMAGYQFHLDRGALNIAAFNLHQVVERLYHCTLLVFSNYSPSSHNINHLRSLAEQYAPDLRPIWPRATRADRKPYNLLKRAYVEARYSRHYKITREELDWLSARTEMLSQQVETACRQRIVVLKG